MQRALVTVRYTICGDPAEFRRSMEKATSTIAETPGLVWKVWAFDTDRDVGISAYLFESEAQAAAFALGPVIKALRGRPDVTEVALEVAAVDHKLSERTGTAAVMARPLSETMLTN